MLPCLLKVRSMVGLIPLLAVAVLEEEDIQHLPGFRHRLLWFMRNRGDLYKQVSMMESRDRAGHKNTAPCSPSPPGCGWSSACCSRMLDEKEFLSPYGICSPVGGLRGASLRSAGGWNTGAPWNTIPANRLPKSSAAIRTGEGLSGFRMNYLLMEGARTLPPFLRGDDLKVECPTSLGTVYDAARQVAREINRRSVFLIHTRSPTRVMNHGSGDHTIHSRRPRTGKA